MILHPHILSSGQRAILGEAGTRGRADRKLATVTPVDSCSEPQHTTHQRGAFWKRSGDIQQHTLVQASVMLKVVVANHRRARSARVAPAQTPDANTFRRQLELHSDKDGDTARTLWITAVRGG